MIDFAGSIMAVYVRDQERARRFYVEKLGFAELANQKYRKDGKDIWWIEVAPPMPEKRDEEVPPPVLALLQRDQLGKGHSGIAFVVDKVQSTYETLKELGVRFEWKPVERDWGWDAQFFDDDDNKVLIVDPFYHKRPLGSSQDPIGSQ
jgi:catechol 2,3-dioxygenase-like lactoylglutathione lyase family enzyme